jgi:hypothetical protein
MMMNRRHFLATASACAASGSFRHGLAQEANQKSDRPDPATVKTWFNAVILQEKSEGQRAHDVLPSETPTHAPEIVLAPPKPPARYPAPASLNNSLAITDTSGTWSYSQAEMSDIKPTTVIIRGPRNLGAFADDQPLFYTLNSTTIGDVTVPPLFVTDLASIPRLFFSELRPDGPYAYAAIVHDWLYWQQTGLRKDADWLLKLGMEAFDVSAFTLNLIYESVRSPFGQRAWDANALLKSKGERRLMAVAPSDPRVKWSEWKKVSSHFP